MPESRLTERELAFLGAVAAKNNVKAHDIQEIDARFKLRDGGFNDQMQKLHRIYDLSVEQLALMLFMFSEIADYVDVNHVDDLRDVFADLGEGKLTVFTSDD